MKCRPVQNLLSEYIDGALDEKKASDVRRHIDRCARCRTLFKELSGIVQLLHELPCVKPPGDFAGEVSRRLESRPRLAEGVGAAGSVRPKVFYLPFLKKAAAAAAAIAVVVTAYVFYKTTAPKGPEPAGRAFLETHEALKGVQKEEMPSVAAASEKGGAAYDEVARLENRRLLKRKTEFALRESETMGGLGAPTEQLERRGAEIAPAAEPALAGETAGGPEGGVRPPSEETIRPARTETEYRETLLSARLEEGQIPLKDMREKKAAGVQGIESAPVSYRARGELLPEAKGITPGKKVETIQIAFVKDAAERDKKSAPEKLFVADEVKIYSTAPDEDCKKIIGLLKEVRAALAKETLKEKIEPAAKPAETRGARYADRLEKAEPFVASDRKSWVQEKHMEKERAREAGKIALTLSEKEYFSLLERIIKIKSVGRILAIKKIAEKKELKEKEALKFNFAPPPAGSPFAVVFRIFKEPVEEAAPAAKEKGK